MNLKQNEAQSARAESTHKELTSAGNTQHKYNNKAQNRGPATVTDSHLAWCIVNASVVKKNNNKKQQGT